MTNATSSVDSTIVIYGLADPLTGEIRYVGKTNCLYKRVFDHVKKAQSGRTHKDNWIRKVGRPGVVILEEVTEETWAERERYWIATFPNLTNVYSGGEGPNGDYRHSDDTRMRMSESAKRCCGDPKERERLRSISNGKPPVRVGSDNNLSKLNEDEVRRMRELASQGISNKELARMFGVTPTNAWMVTARKTWTHV